MGLRKRPTKKADESDDEEETDERRKAVKKWAGRLNWVWRKIQAAFWVGAACVMIWWTNFFRVIWEPPLVNRTYFYLALACLTFNMSMIFYLAIWLASIKGVEEPWDTHSPKAIPVMAVVGCLTVFLFFFAFWKVWGFMTLGIQLVFFLGFINAGQFLPGGAVGSVLMFVIFFGAFLTSELIPHEGLAHYQGQGHTR